MATTVCGVGEGWPSSRSSSPPGAWGGGRGGWGGGRGEEGKANEGSSEGRGSSRHGPTGTLPLLRPECSNFIYNSSLLLCAALRRSAGLCDANVTGIGRSVTMKCSYLSRNTTNYTLKTPYNPVWRRSRVTDSKDLLLQH